LFIARAFGRPGEVVDLFAGAGGLSLGFHWAGWTGLVASDIDANAMASFTRNVHTNTIVGDIRSKSLRKEIAERLHGNRSKKKPLILLGGPPCQGFSTAGNRRSLDDERNHLFRDYIALVDALAPDAFVFENVPGILNMEGGAVFKEILAALRRVSTDTRVWQLSAEEFGVPQRRRRVVVVGFRKMKPVCNPTGPLQDGLFGGTPVSVKAALEDLPPLNAGEDGSTKEYLSAPLTPFQALMRGRMDPGRYVDSLKPQHPFESNRPQLSSKSNGART
jgi:DNA (cytosine-5)-methyltransferase 1